MIILVRFFLLSSHYRSQVNFSDSALDEAHNSLSRLYNALKIAEQHQSQALEADQELINQAYQSAAGQDFIAAMNDDFNSSAAISVLFSLASEVNKAAKAQDTDKAWQLAQQLRALAKSLNILQQPPKQFLQAVIGEKSENGLSDDAIDALIAERGDAKANKDYARADEIRLQLKEAGIELEVPTGVLQVGMRHSRIGESPVPQSGPDLESELISGTHFEPESLQSTKGFCIFGHQVDRIVRGPAGHHLGPSGARLQVHGQLTTQRRSLGVRRVCARHGQQVRHRVV